MFFLKENYPSYYQHISEYQFSFFFPQDIINFGCESVLISSLYITKFIRGLLHFWRERERFAVLNVTWDNGGSYQSDCVISAVDKSVMHDRSFVSFNSMNFHCFYKIYEQ